VTSVDVIDLQRALLSWRPSSASRAVIALEDMTYADVSRSLAFRSAP